MKSIRIFGKQDIRATEQQVPEPGPGEVRLKVAYVGICGSDLHYFFEGANGTFQIREPLSPGHEFSAVVDLDPSGTYPVGAPVTVHPAQGGDPQPHLEEKPHLWPGVSYMGSASTDPHTQGAMTEYVIVASSMVRILPEGIDLKAGALAEPLAVSLHGVALAGGARGKRVLVCGAGPIGLLALAGCVAQGAAAVDVTDVLDEPLQRALRLGAERVINVRHESVAAGQYDVVLECSGVPVSIDTAFAAVRPAGTVVQLGMASGPPSPAGFAMLLPKEITYVGSFRFADEFDAAIQLLVEHPHIADVVTHVFSADDVVEAFSVAANSAESGKVLVSMQ